MEKTIQCVVICLNRERQRRMERQIKNLGITFPVYYLEASVPENTGSYFPQNTSLRDKRHMCCARSHNRAIQYASQDSSADFTVILEDDVGIHTTEFIRTVKELASRWSEITAQGKHSVALGWIPDHNYNNYSIHANAYTKLRSTNPDILFFDLEEYKRHISGLQAYMIEKTYAKQVAAVVMKDTFQEMYESIHRQKYRFLDPTNNLLASDFYIHHAFNPLVTFPPLAIEFKTTEQVNPQNELQHWVPFFKGHEAKREEYWKPGETIAWFTSGKDDYEQALLPQLDMDIVCIVPNTDTSVYKDIHKVIIGSYTPKESLTGKHIIRLVTTNPLIDDIERYTNNLKRVAHTPNEVWLKGNLTQYTSYLETLYSVPVVCMPALKPPILPEAPPYKAKAEETALDIVIMEKNTNFNTSGWKALTICEQLYLQTPERIHQVFFINTPKENPTSMGMIQSLKLKQDGKLRLFNTPTTAEIIQYFLTVSNNVVFLSNQIFDDMNYGYYAVVQTGFPLVHSSSELKAAGIGRYYDSNTMLEAVGHLREPFARKTPRIPKLVHQTWETKDLPPAMKATLDYNKAQNPEFEFILYDDQDRIQFLETHFDAPVVNAYHTLVPGAYRADLFRYCVLYVLGGIYMDMRFQCAEGFHLTDIAEPQYVRDITHWGTDVVYNGIIVSNSNNKTLFECIMKIVKHCEECYYGPNPLCITGPVLLGNCVKEEPDPCIQMYVCETAGDKITIKRKDIPLFYTYELYNTDKSTIQPYWRTWDLREVFGEVNIGTSESDTKLIKLQKSYPDGWECIIAKHGFSDRFETSIHKDILTVKRLDSKAPWGWPHKGKIVPRSAPKLVHQTWETKDLPPAMKATLDYNKAQNPEFKFILYDDQDRIQFLETHFDSSVVKAYHTLVPGAYRADLFRYCVLYVLGGIYMDIRFQCADGFRFTDITGPQYVKDRAMWGPNVIYNGFMVSKASNKTLYDCIQEIVRNCENATYGQNPLCPTGPFLLGKYVKEEANAILAMKVSDTVDSIVTIQEDRVLLTTYQGYYEERKMYVHYWEIWEKRQIYGEVTIGTSESDTKLIKLQKSYPEGWECIIAKHGFPDRFETTVNKDILTVKRIDHKGAWAWPHKGKIMPRSVPKLVHQTWETKDLPAAMKAAFEYNQAQNPEFKFILYDDQDRIAFLRTHFDTSVLHAYHTLAPGAYRADLFRYCVLYVLGGIYMDMRFQCAEGFRLTDIAEPQYVRDMEHWGNKDTICNGLIVSNPINKTLFKCIQEIVTNCKGAIYGKNPFWPTGPCLLGKYVKEESMPRVDIHISKVGEQVVLVKNKNIIMTTYTDYNKDRSIMPHYYKMWENGEIYGEVTIGPSTSDTKIIKLHKSYPDGWECIISKHGFSDRFETTVHKDILTVKRIDTKSAWAWSHTGKMTVRPAGIPRPGL